MRALLDTNILIHREAAVVVRGDIGLVFNWLDRLGYEKCVHPVSIGEIQQHRDERVRNSFVAKIASYRVLKAPAAMAPKVQALSAALDLTENDKNDSKILNELFAEHVDLLISEDRAIFRKAEQLGIADRVFTIDAFLEKVVAENPELIEYRVPSVRKVLFGTVDPGQPFFDSFREDYPDFNRWFARKSEEPAYACFEGDRLVAFLYLKVEDQREPYPDIVPAFRPKRRLKIGTFRVDLNGFKLGERLLKIVFDNAIKQRVEEVYLTVFPRAEQERLIKLVEDFGFTLHGEKRNPYGTEHVYVRDMTPRYNQGEPSLTFPFVSLSARAFLVSIYPEYHTELFPDSILRTESPSDFIEPEPHRNAIRKVYVSRSYFRDLQSGDVIVFYRTSSGFPAYHTSVVTTLGIVERVYLQIESEDQFVRLCRKRSVFSDEKLREQWRAKPHCRPFIVAFLYAYSFPRRPNLASLIQHGVIRDTGSAPRGFERISREQFETILRLSGTDMRLVVD